MPTKSSTDYGRRVRGLAYGLWKGEIELLQFVESMVDAIGRGYEQAWQEGAASVGVTPGERTPEEQEMLLLMEREDISHLMPYAQFILDQREGKRSSVLARAELWAARYTAVSNRAAVESKSNAKLVWYLGRTEKHCKDCLTYEGRVHRASAWLAVGAMPQSRNLECGGWLCDCRLVPTTAPALPGLPPQPSFQKTILSPS